MTNVKEVLMSVDDITPYEKNNKIHTQKNIEEIAESIREFGYLSKVGVDENGVILYGEGRYFALRDVLGEKQIKVQKILHLDEAKKRAFRIIDNKMSDNSVYNQDAIDSEISWLVENMYETNSSLLNLGLDDMMDESSLEIEDTLADIHETEMDDVFDRASKPRVASDTPFEELFIEPGARLVYKNLTIINSSMDKGLDAMYILDGGELTSLKTFSDFVVFVRSNYKLLGSCNKTPLVWHKGSAASIDSSVVLNDCVELVGLSSGTEFKKRRFNNLLTAIPSQDTPNNPPIQLITDLIENFIPSGKIIVSTFEHAAVPLLLSGITSYLYIESPHKINDALRDIRSEISPKAMCTITMNETEVQF